MSNFSFFKHAMLTLLMAVSSNTVMGAGEHPMMQQEENHGAQAQHQPHDAQGIPLNNRVYISLFDSRNWVDTFYVIDTRSNEVKELSPLQIGRPPIKAMAFDANNNHLYVMDYFLPTSSMYVFDADTNQKLEVIEGLRSPSFFVLNNANNHLYTLHQADNFVRIFDLNTREPLSTINVGVQPVHAVYNPSTHYLYVVNRDSSSVSVVNTKTYEVITIDVDAEPQQAILDNQNNRVYVVSSEGNSITVIDTATNQRLRTIHVGNYPINAALNSVTNQLYIATLDNHSIAVIDLATDQIVKTIDVKHPPQSVLFSPTNSYLYVLTHNNVISIDTNTDEIIDVPLPINDPRSVSKRMFMPEMVQNRFAKTKSAKK